MKSAVEKEVRKVGAGKGREGNESKGKERKGHFGKEKRVRVPGRIIPNLT